MENIYNIECITQCNIPCIHDILKRLQHEGTIHDYAISKELILVSKGQELGGCLRPKQQRLYSHICK